MKDRSNIKRATTDASPAHRPSSLVEAWIALEALSPRTFREREDLVDGGNGSLVALSKDRLPWRPPERPRQDHRLYYHVVLGEIPMDVAMTALVRAFGDDEELPRREREKAAVASILVDAQGVVADDKAGAISSFAWALPLVLAQRLDDLGAWNRVERRLLEELRRIVCRVDDEDRPVPLDFPTILKAREWLMSVLRLPADLVAAAPPFALRVHQSIKAKNRPDPLLLNSLLLDDLARVSRLIEGDGAAAGLRSYVGGQSPHETIDLLSDRAALERVLAPAGFPSARWPVPGGHSLALLQQAAVNAGRAQLADSDGIVAVNGPPGTGKTTLLRDLIAQCVVDRAAAMASFDDPDDAFSQSGTRLPIGDQGYINLYRLDPSLKGHEAVIASSNNRAVENVSTEVPAMAEISRPDLRYFKSVSDSMFEALARARGHEQQLEPVDTWGLIAAVLGNSNNRAAFQRAFWWDDDRSLRIYLKAAKGDSVVREERDPKTKKLIKRSVPRVVTEEQPATSSMARKNWIVARSRFVALKQEIETEIAALERVRQTCLKIAKKRRSIEEQERECRLLTEEVRAAEATRQTCQRACDGSMSELRSCDEALESHKHFRPGWFARLFRTRRWQAWSAEAAPLIEARRLAIQSVADDKKALVTATEALNKLSTRRDGLERALSPPRREIDKLEQSIASVRAALGDRMVDEDFLAREHRRLHVAATWMPDALQRKREDLFVAAMAVHKAFIDVAAAKLLHNLSFFMNVLGSSAMPDEKKPELLTDLWSTLFAVVPVVSTTFASVGRMFGELPPGSLGWLFIDEAGQGRPQEAVGAIMRARRAIVVGDPLQIPPVTTLPERLVQEICEHFKVDPSKWAAPKASAQTLADRASPYQSAFQDDTGPRNVGIPLLVHRRCQDPMFSISNTIAYNGLMVHAAGPRAPGAIGDVLGCSQWFDVDGEASSKWCPQEGEFVVDLLYRLADAGVVEPDIFVISPFRVVAHSMRRRLQSELRLMSAFNVSAGEWVNVRVGTIHTFQGGQADTVILLLGAPNVGQHGARNWAAQTPNILNVAVSRAKQNFYVVGSHAAWSGVGRCGEVARSLPVTRVELST